jgi:hypothetical protein
MRCAAGVDPADHTARVEDIARDVDLLERVLDVAAHTTEHGHAISLQTPIRAVN